MIKKIIIKNLNTTLSMLAVGKIKFYDNNGDLIESGSVISSTGLVGETENFKCNVNKSYTGSYPINIIDYDTSNFWLSATKTNVSIEISFKKIVDSISKISFIPLPGTQTTNGINNNFDIEVYDYNDEIIYSYNITPISTRNKEQVIETNELVSYYIISNGETVSTTNTNRLQNVRKIKSIEIDHLEPESTNIRYLFSIDGKSSWFIIKNNIVQTVDINNIISEGMTKSDIESIKNYTFESTVNLDIMVAMQSTTITKGPIIRNILIYYI